MILDLGLGRGVCGEGVGEVVVGVGVWAEGGARVVVADGRHDGNVAIVGGIIGAGYTCQRTVSVIVLEAIGRVEAFRVSLMIVVGGEVGLLLAEIGGALCLLRGG